MESKHDWKADDKAQVSEVTPPSPPTSTSIFQSYINKAIFSPVSTQSQQQLQQLHQQNSTLTPDDVTKLLRESCLAKAILGGATGYGFGLLLGTFVSSTSLETNLQPEHWSTWQKVIDGFKQTGRSSAQTAKNFAYFSLIFSGSECAIEKYRGRADHYNGITAGCLTGAGFGIRAGPQSALIGCAGVAAFSAVIEIAFSNR